MSRNSNPLMITVQDHTRNGMHANPSQGSRLEAPAAAALRRRPASSLSDRPEARTGSAADALRFAAVSSSEPSHSERTSMDVTWQQTADPGVRRKSVSFEDERRSSGSPAALAHQSPFRSYSQLPPNDISLSSHGRRRSAEGQQPFANGNGQPCLDSSATSAPIATLDAAASLWESTRSSTAQRRSNDSSGSSGSRLSAAQHLAQLQGQPPQPQPQPGSAAGTPPKGGTRTAAGRAFTQSSPSALTLPLDHSAPARGDSSVEGDPQVGPLVPTAAELAGFLQEAFGAHLAPAGGSSNPISRSSIDLLLDSPSSGTPSRHSLDSLQELLSAPRLGVQGRSMGNVAALVRNSGYTTSRQSLQALAPHRISHGSSATSLNDLASGSVTIVAHPTGPGHVGGASAAACASSVVDTYSPGTTPPGRPMASFLEEPLAMMDADVHDTFGAHAAAPLPSAIVPAQQQQQAARGGAGGSGGAAAGGRTNLFGAQAVAIRAGAAVGGGGASAQSPRRRGGPDASPGGGGGGSVQGGALHVQGTAPLLEPTAVHGQHSVTLHDAQCTVPSYQFLRQRQLARARQASEGAAAWGGGYIAEAKRVLSEAMSNASKDEADICDTSYSGAIGPLMRHLRLHSGDEARARAGLHTLSLLVSNQPNRTIIAGLQGQGALAGVLRDCAALDVREQCVQLMWDLDDAGGKDSAPMLQLGDVFALLSVLEVTGNAGVASHALHFLRAAMELPPGRRIALTPEQAESIAARVVREVCSHKHHLQDAAQYTVGALLGAVLEDPGVSEGAVTGALTALLAALQLRPGVTQCQVLLTVVSCLAGKPRLRAALMECNARRALLQFSTSADDARLQARALSLVKVSNREESVPASWYYGPEGEGRE